MPIHVHIITQVRPRMGMEWKFLCLNVSAIAYYVKDFNEGHTFNS